VHSSVCLARLLLLPDRSRADTWGTSLCFFSTVLLLQSFQFHRTFGRTCTFVLKPLLQVHTTILSSQILASPQGTSFPPSNVSLEYKQVTFMTVLLGCLYDAHVRHFSDPLLFQSMHIEAWRCAGMGAYLLSVHLGHVWEGRLTSRALHTTLYVIHYTLCTNRVGNDDSSIRAW